MMTTVTWCNKPNTRNQKQFPTKYSGYPEYFKISSNGF